MQILICSNYKNAWNSVRPEAEMFIEMVKAGHQVTVMTQGDAEYVSRFKDCGIKVIDCYPSKKICFRTIKAIRQELAAKHYDIVYAMNSKTIPNAAFACIGFNKTRFVTYRGTVGGLYRHDPSAYLTHLHPRVNGISCVAEAVAEDVKKHVWKNKDHVVAIYKGHNISWYNAMPTERISLGIPDDAICVICIANARRSKGLHVLLDSAKQLASEQKVHLLLVGNDMDTPENKKLSEQSGMAERIHFLGFRRDVPSLLAASDIQVQPSISGEGLPKTLVEAMATGIPSVVTTTGGGKELILDGESGFIVPVNDSKALANKILKLCVSETLRHSMGRKAKQRIETDFSSARSAAEHIKFFRSLL